MRWFYQDQYAKFSSHICLLHKVEEKEWRAWKETDGLHCWLRNTESVKEFDYTSWDIRAFFYRINVYTWNANVSKRRNYRNSNSELPLQTFENLEGFQEFLRSSKKANIYDIDQKGWKRWEKNLLKKLPKVQNFYSSE